MKKFIPTLLAILLLVLTDNAVYAQNLQLQWAKAIAGNANIVVGRSVIDAQDNIYIYGSFSGTADFDPGPGTAQLSTGIGLGMGGAFFAKYDAQGNYIFAHKLNDSANAGIRFIALDNSGNICIVGSFRDTVDFDPGTGTANQVSAGSSDIFVAKYDADGNYQSAFIVGGPGSEHLETAAMDANNNIYITGNFGETADFDPGTGVLNVVNTSSDDYTYLAKYDATGNVVFAFALNQESEGNTVAVDGSGNVHLGGTFFTSIDLDPGPGTASVSSVGGVDGYHAKYDTSGNYLTGTGYDGIVYFVETDSDDNLYVVGHFPDSMDADPGPGVAMLYSVNFFDVFIVKYDPNGNYIYARAMESNVTYTENGITLTHEDHAYIYGRTPDTLNVNPGGPGGLLTSQGGFDGFIAKYYEDGTFADAVSFGGAGADVANGITTDAQANVWVTGTFNDTVDFDFGNATANLVSDTASGGFIAKYTDLQAVSVPTTTAATAKIKAYGTDNSVIVDFTSLDKVNAEVTVTNMLGQTVAKAKHSKNDMLKINIPDAAVQLYVVIINNNGMTSAEKVWVK